MKVTAEVKGREINIVTMDVTVPAAELEPALDKAAKKIAKEVKIPGFRPGHIPRTVLENYVGEAAMLQEAFDILLPDSYGAALDATDIFPVDRPRIDVKTLEKGKDIVYEVKVVVKPEVELGEYKGVEVTREVEVPTDEDVDKEIEKMRERVGQMEDLEGDATVEMKDIAVIDFEGFKDGVAFEGGKGDNYPLSIGSGSFIPGFEEQLIGAKIGDEVEVKVTFPEQYQSEELAGKDAVFKVKVHEIRRRKLPEINDEFVKDVREDCDTVAELRTKLMEELTEAANQKADELVKRDVMEKVLDAAKVEIPGVMVEDKIDQLVEEFESQLKYQGLDLKRFLEFAKLDLPGFREQNRPKAEANVKQDLVLEAIAKAENIEATEEDINKQLEDIAKAYDKELAEVKTMFENSGNMVYFEYNIKMMKAIDFINDNAVIK